jgi:predicted metalloprotease with PDZ domain
MRLFRALLWLCLWFGPVAAQEAVRYELSFPNAVHHEAEVRATFTGLAPGPLEVVMSRSSPGRYALHEFAKNVYNVRATDGGGRALPVSRPAPHQWNVSGHNGTVIFSYTLFGDRLDGTYVAIDATHAHLNPPAALVWARGLESRPVVLRLEPPEGSGWEAATQLEPAPGGAWRAPSLDMLMDSPVELSRHAAREWQAGGQRFRIALHGEAGELDSFTRMCEAVVREAAGVFGQFPRFDNGVYTFLIDYLPYATGDGMEHRNSTVITAAAAGRRSLRPLLGGVAHEFFHAWNVERMRPRSLEPFDFERANPSAELWFAEGFTSYYESLIQARAGLLDLDGFAAEIGGWVSQVLTAPGRRTFSAADMSLRAAFEDGASSLDPTNRANIFVSYYTYGAALGLGIDLAIRGRFPGKSLDDWMRAVWRAHPDVARPYNMDDLQAALAQATGPEFAAEVFRRHITGTEPMDFAALLARAGLALRPRQPGRVWLGQTGVNASDRGVLLTGAVLRDSPLYRAGVDRGDRLIKLGRRELKSQRDLDRALEDGRPGERVALLVESRAGRREVELEWQEAPGLEVVTYEKVPLPVTGEIRAFRSAWLESKALRD